MSSPDVVPDPGFLVPKKLDKMEREGQDQVVPGSQSNKITPEISFSSQTVEVPSSRVNLESKEFPLEDFTINEMDKIESQHAELKDFKLIRMVGKGGFAKVYQAIRKTDGKTFALKVMRKDVIKKLRQTNHVMNEKNILKSLSGCKYLVDILTTFQDHVHLFMIQEFLVGGDLFSFIKTHGHLSDQHAQFYAAEVFLALEFLHKNGIVYRDLKPENILFDAQGHIRLADLGFAKPIMNEKTTTFCGTPSYLAPEILQKKPYSYEVDWWAFGIIIFQLCCGCSPFQESHPSKTFARILHCAIRWPPDPQVYFTNEAFDIITQLLELEPQDRLYPEEIRAEDWFRNLDWVSLENGKIKPPIFKTVITDNSHPMTIELSTGDFTQSTEQLFKDF